MLLKGLKSSIPHHHFHRTSHLQSQTYTNPIWDMCSVRAWHLHGLRSILRLFGQPRPTASASVALLIGDNNKAIQTRALWRRSSLFPASAGYAITSSMKLSRDATRTLDRRNRYLSNMPTCQQRRSSSSAYQQASQLSGTLL
jgi:hypothetical protein